MAPVPSALTYSVPQDARGWLRPGMRVKVPLGRRNLRGVVLRLPEKGPAGVRLRDIAQVLDREPVLTTELLDLATFIAGYYLEPIGEVVRSMVVGDLPPWGNRRVWLTDGGALSAPKDDDERRVIEALREVGRIAFSELRARAPVSNLAALLERLRDQGRVGLEERRAAGSTRYVSAVELPPGDLAEQLAAAGASKPGQAVIEHLATIGRPATVEEVTTAVGCRAGVVRRLVKLGILRKFTQVDRMDLERHFLEGASERPTIVLRPDQRQAADALVAAVESRTYSPFLLAGMTGSGKTEVYLRAADAVLEQGRSVLLLVPEIALVPALGQTVRERYGERLAILHSNLGSSERHQEWERIRDGRARVVLGPRSALFAPLAGLGLVVIDEEQDPAYKQDSVPRYHGRDLALVRARRAGAAAVLASATPSMESRYNAEVGKARRVELTARAGQGTLPRGILVDLRKEARNGPGSRRKPGEIVFSDRLLAELEASFTAGEQVVLLRNRRGYSPMLLCRACGEDLRCEQCGLPRTFHRREGSLQCHYCGGRQRAPERCPECDEEALEPIGAGTERVEEDFKRIFPDQPVGVLDRDSARRPGGAAAVLERFARGEARVLIGTQMISKGHHFPNVGLAVVLSADTYLSFPDFRAVEKTYNLLVQLAGRAGRGERPGRVVIQTFHPEHYAIRAALEHDDAAFAREEMRFRREFHYPPFTRMIQVLSKDRDRGRAEGALRRIAERVIADSRSRTFRMTGPAPAPLERLKDRWRFQLLLRGANGRLLREVLKTALEDAPAVDLAVDVDPLHLL